MPFTFSHPAIVLPLNYLPKRWISITALIIGSITPDFEYFIRFHIRSVYSHTWPGLFWFDLPLGLILYFIYNEVVKNTLIDHLPVFANRRFSGFKNINSSGYSFGFIIVMLASILVGAASHILWDSFTHPLGYFVKAIPALSLTVGLGAHQFHIYNLIQHASTVLGGVVIFVTIVCLPQGAKTKVDNIIPFWLIVVVAGMLTLTIKLLTGTHYP